MSTDDKNQDGAATDKSGEEGAAGASAAKATSISLSKEEYDSLVADRASFGSLKREFKDLKKSLEERDTTSQKNQPDNGLLQKAFLRSAGIVEKEEVELALSTAKKWGVEVDELVGDEDFKLKLEKVRTQKANELATSGVQGGGGTSGTKNTPEYWVAKGTPPSSEDVPDKAARRKIARALMANSRPKSGFYDD